MPRYIAFLRAINVGGHVVKMARLKELFESAGFSDVETFIASGNVIFNSTAADAPALEEKIEQHLHRGLGYEVKTFLRSDAELARIARRRPFGSAASAGATVFIGFLQTDLDGGAAARLRTAETSTDQFRIVGREVYWRCLGPSHQSAFSGARLEKLLGAATTLRNENTVRRLAARYPPNLPQDT